MNIRDATACLAAANLERTIKGNKAAQAAYATLMDRLAYLDTLIATWDTTHDAHGRKHLAVGHYEAASTAATLVFDPALRAALLRDVHRAQRPDAAPVQRDPDTIPLFAE